MSTMTLREFSQITDHLPDTKKLPAIFVGHGNPMNAIECNKFTDAWGNLGRSLTAPNAILSISAHWLTNGTFVHIGEKPKTIHDFSGFPEELFQVMYPCPGSPAFALAAQRLLSGIDAKGDKDWGIDHGTWSVLVHMFPEASVPVFQMSIDIARSASQHFELGKMLRKLRSKGVLVIGSGNIVHNLRKMSWEKDAEPFDWAVEFDGQVKSLIEKRDYTALCNYEKLGNEALRSIPTPDHYWPLLYILGLVGEEDLTFPVTGIAHASISMRAVLVGN